MKRCSRWYAPILAIVWAASGLPSTALSDPRDLDPLLVGYELPPMLEADLTAPPRVSIEYAIGNTSSEQLSLFERVALDAEVGRAQLTISTPLSTYWRLRCELPWVWINGGMMDGMIEGFHSTFFLPNGNRDAWPRDRLLIEVRDAHGDYQLYRPQSGVGDIALRLGRKLGQTPTLSVSTWISLKLPTGNGRTLTGSGSTDLSATLTAEQLLSDTVSIFGQLGVSGFTRGSRLPDAQQAIAGSVHLGARLSAFDHMALEAQIDTHTRVFRSDTRMLGTSTQIAFGPRYERRGWVASLWLVEDLANDTAPDFQIELQLSRHFGH